MAGQGYQFINMLLDKQGQQARLDYQSKRDSQEDLQRAMSQVAGAAGSIRSSLSSEKKDAIANVLMNEMKPPRAEAADPELAQAMAAVGMGGTNPARGGVDELNMRMALQDRQDRNADRRFDNVMAAARELRMGEILTERKSQIQHDQATDLSRQTNQKTKDMVTAAGAYTRNMALLRKSLAAAQASGDFDSYDAVASDMQALHYGTVSAGVKMPELKIPPFQDPGQAEIISGIQAEIDANNTAMAGGDKSKGNFMWWGGTPREEVAAGLNKRLTEAKAKGTREVTAYEPDPADDDQGIPVGTVAVNQQTGERIRWNGTAWEKVQ